MDNFKENLRNSELVNIYSSLLSETQRDILREYFCYDLSLSEIAENRGISRAAVEDAIKKGMKKIDCFEEELGILQKREKTLKITAKIKEKYGNSDEIDELERLVK